MVILLLATACSGDDDIPKDPGTFADVADIRSAWLPGNPDHWLIIQTLRSSSTYGDPACPVETENDLELSWDGDCTDSAGASWTGSATVRDAENHQDFLDWGLSLDGTSWTIDGEMDWSFPDPSEPELQVEIDVTLTWDDGETTRVASLDLTYLHHNDAGSDELLWSEGELGLSDWGTATVTTDALRLGRANSCHFPNSGELVMTAANTASVPFDTTHCLDECPQGHIGADPVGDLCLDGGVPTLPMPGYGVDTAPL